MNKTNAIASKKYNMKQNCKYYKIGSRNINFPRQIGEILSEILRSDLIFASCYRKFKVGKARRKEVSDGK